MFNVKPSNVTAFVGEPAWVHCQGEGTPTPSVNYLRKQHKQQKQQTAMLNETRFKTLKNNTLYVKNLEKGDDGSYFCWLTQPYNRQPAISEFYLTVRGKTNCYP